MVETILSEDLSTIDCKTFTKSENAENYFKKCAAKYGVTDEFDLDCCIDDGFCDTFDENGKDVCIMIKEITFEDI